MPMSKQSAGASALAGYNQLKRKEDLQHVGSAVQIDRSGMKM